MVSVLLVRKEFLSATSFPSFFTLYVLPLGSIFKNYNTSFHCFADDVQIYLTLKSNSPPSVQVLLDCLKVVKSWMEVNFHNLEKKNETEIILFWRKSPSEDYISAIGSLASYCHPSAKNLGMIFDEDFRFDKKIRSVVKMSFSQLRLLPKVKAYPPTHDFERVIHAFITLQLDYCNFFILVSANIRFAVYRWYKMPLPAGLKEMIWSHCFNYWIFALTSC